MEKREMKSARKVLGCFPGDGQGGVVPVLRDLLMAENVDT